MENSSQGPRRISGPRRILVADDSSSGRMLVVGVLTQHGFRVAHASSAEQLTALLASDTYDAVVLNLTMPPNHGPEYVSHVRSLMPEQTQLVVYSILDQDEVEASVKRAGADHFFQTPIQFAALVRQLEASDTPSE
ncbi:MAG: response regulator [Gammaproteobacteria bacterium]